MAIYTDNFNRADDSTGIGGSWLKIDANGAAAKLGISTNRAAPLTASSGGTPMYVYNNTFGADQYAQIEIGSGSSFLGGFTYNPYIGVILRGGAASSGNGYLMQIRDVAGGAVVTIVAYSGGFGGATILSPSAITLAVGDVIRAEVSGTGASTNFVIKKNGSQIYTATDTAGTYSSGKAGISGFYLTTVGTNMFMDNWEGGDLAASSSSVVPEAAAFYRMLANA